MAEPRTEGAGIAGTLTITLGGVPRTLRCLTIEQSEEWLSTAGRLIAAMEVDDDAEESALLSSLMRAGTTAAVQALAAYDRDGVLGGIDAIRRVATPPEVRTAVEVVVEAAVPFDVDAARLVAAAFGGPTRTLALVIAAVMQERLRLQLHPARSTPGPSIASASDTTGSDASGPPSSSSSAGPTATNGSERPRSTSATRSRTASAPGTSRPA